ncbi:MAG: hypothetical protein COU81_00980 [Candidatus Portnoybacteria bacterium CG10_big_fil_rev_8_21_14_0_10_36_7]|uniref:Type II secretion system protein GspG C-terminal domain-containing protein n=1 Tax=Candidatus Portnoybacteria bacterium CG10_big_fil_rev_8_21_14_0_10_36_7 TaxID=1974812 RepID=A0A2M8KET3_9BACT|nr:MAG: hypothetical protein COU81_00980 [Candidatus Portnoybacteria bacterium CG10_big_fil_rev_8_21_14_0_10_36_7]
MPTGVNKRDGFTLIELLVVIFIIALLASIVGVSINKQRIRSRNAKRNADIRQLINAFALINADNLMPVLEGALWCILPFCRDPFGGTYSIDESTSTKDLLSQYLNSSLSDPPGGRNGAIGYWYQSNFPDYTSVVYPSLSIKNGPVLYWSLEPDTITMDSCKPGIPIMVQESPPDPASRTICMVNLDYK